MRAIGKEAITIHCQLVRFQINNQCIPYGPAMSLSCISIEGLQLTKILYKMVQSLKFSKDCKIAMKDCNLI